MNPFASTLQPVTPAASETLSPAASPVRRTAAETLDDQVAWFLDHYSGGFQTPLWRSDLRGEGVRKRLKRHRGPAIAQARELLDGSVLRARLAGGDAAGVIASLVEVLRATSLAPVGQARRLQELAPSEQAALARALVAHARPGPEGDAALGGFVSALEPVLPNLRCAWSLVTAVRALLFPQRHVCVVPGKFALQARIQGDEVPEARRPCERDYLRYRKLAANLERSLRARGLAPRDMLDVLDFMRTTLSPRARLSLAGAAHRREERLGSGRSRRGVA